MIIRLLITFPNRNQLKFIIQIKNLMITCLMCKVILLNHKKSESNHMKIELLQKQNNLKSKNR